MSEIKKLLCISILYPLYKGSLNGIFVQRQLHSLKSIFDIDIDVIQPIRTQMPLEVIRDAKAREIWKEEQAKIPFEWIDDMGIRVYQPRFWSPPRQIGHFLWGTFALRAIKEMLIGLCEERKYDLIFSHNAQPCGYIGNYLQKKFHIPNIIMVHGEDVLGQDSPPHYKRMFGKWAIGKTYRDARLVLGNSKRTLGLIKELSPQNSDLLHLGISPVQLLRSRLVLEGDEINIIIIGNITPQKGHKILLPAIAGLRIGYPQIRLKVIGKGWYESDIRALATSLGLMDITQFYNELSMDEVYKQLTQSDIFVMPSWNEGFGIVYLEAMSAGLPIIGTIGEGVEDIFEYGKIGLLVPKEQVGELMDAIAYLIEHREEASNMGEEGSTIAKEHFSWDRSSRSIYDFFLSTIQSH